MQTDKQQILNLVKEYIEQKLVFNIIILYNFI